MVDYPQNELTRAIEDVASGNRSGIRRDGVASATPLPTARSADLGRMVEQPPPMTAAEREELDRLAIQAGVKDERLGTAEEAAGAYPSMEAALAAGASVPIERVASRQTAREFVASRNQSRLPNFRAVEGIDLIQGRVLIDGMEFPIPEADAVGFKQYVIEVARQAIMDKLTEAASLFEAPEAGVGSGDDETVRAVSTGETEV